jgi:long-chain acyl-CoA synthetase
LTDQTLQTLVEALDRYASRPALLAMGEPGDGSRSYAELSVQAAGLAAGLAASGLKPGDPCVICAPNSIPWIVTCLALFRVGAVPVPVDNQAGGAALAHIMADCGAAWMFTTSSVASRVNWSDRPATRVVLFDQGDAAGERWLDLLAMPTEQPTARASGSDRAVLFYTSGTSGPPKGVPLTHRNILSNLNALLAQNLVRPDDRVLLPLPLHHVYPFVVGLLVALASGLAVVLPRSLTGGHLQRALQEGEVSVILGVPRLYEALTAAIEQRFSNQGRWAVAGYHGLLSTVSVLRRLVRAEPGRWFFAGLRRRLAPRLRLLVSGGAALSADMAELLQALGWQVASGYGLTETAPILTWNVPGRGRLDTVGQPLPGVQLAIAAPTAGRRYGEVLARGANVFAGYHHLPEQSAAAFTADGWFCTGDLGVLDAAGYLHLHGRASSTIVLPGGENVDPESLEAALASCPSIREVGVLEHDGRLAAILVPLADAARGQSDDALRQRLTDEIKVAERTLPSYQRLNAVAVDLRPLARTRLGKLRRQQLVARYQDHLRGTAVPRQVTDPSEFAPEDRQLLDDPIASRVWHWLQQRFPDQSLSPDVDPRMDLQVDSMDWLNLTLELREVVGVELDAEAVGRIQTLRDLLRETLAAETATPGAQDVVARLRDPETALSADQQLWLAPPSGALALLGIVLQGLARVLMRGFFRLRVTGLETVPVDGPCLFAPNHLSALDPIAVLVALGPERLCRTYWGGWVGIMFDRPLMRLVSRSNRVLPVEPSRGSLWNLELAAAALRRGNHLVWFPEGGRSPDGTLQPFRAGVGLLLQAQPVPVIPVWIAGTAAALPPGKLWPKRRQITVTLGSPINPGELLGDALGADQAAGIAAAIHHRVAALGGVQGDSVPAQGATVGWEHFEHEADIGLRATAATREALFELLGEALTAVVTEPRRVRPEQERVIRCAATDDALLVVDWLNELIFAMATEHLLFSRWQVRLEDGRLEARVRGETVDRQRHQPVVEVKGATYTALKVEQAPDGLWHAQCVVDV